MFKDDTIITFTDSFEMKEHMIHVEGEWISKYAINHLDFRAPSEEECNSEALRDTVLEGTGIAVEINGDIYGVRDCALQSLFRRCAISGDALNSINKHELAELLNLCAGTREGKTKILITDDKISAFLSDDGNGLNYSTLPSVGIFRMTEEKIAEMIGDEPERFYGVWTFNGIRCRWTLPKEKYLNGEDYKVQLSLSTSDVGTGAVEYAAALVGNGKTIPIVSPVKVTHRLASQSADVSEVLDMMEAMIDDSVRNIDAMDKIQIENPINCMRRIMKFVKLPHAKSLEVIEDYEKSYDGNGDNARNLYLKICDVVNNYASSQSNMLYQNVVRNNVLKVKGIDWKKYDLPGTFSW